MIGRSLVVAVVGALLVSVSAVAGPALRNPCTLLSAGQVAPILGGAPTGHALRAVGTGRTCIWIGPALGYMQTQSMLYVSVSHMSKSRFLANESETHAERVSGLDGLGYQDRLELLVWKDNTLIVLINPNLALQPSKAIALARAALTNL